MATGTYVTGGNQVLGMLDPIFNEKETQEPHENFAAVPITKNKLIKFGRSERGCELVFGHPSGSSIHCIFWAIRFDDDSVPMFYVKDCSLNGTLVNGLSLKRGQTCLLEDEDIVTIPNACAFRFTAKIKLLTSDLIDQLGFQVDVDNWHITPKVVGSGTFGHVVVAHEKKDSTTHLSLIHI